MSLQLNGTDGVTYNDGTLQSSAPVGKNLIINGDMTIDQRGATVTSAGYTVDRWGQDQTGGGGISYVKSTDAPDGFSHSLSATVTTTDDPASGDYYRLFQRIEGYNVSQLDIGTSSAKTITVSFWVKSSVNEITSNSILMFYRCSTSAF
jgi:hypothetical protein